MKDTDVLHAPHKHFFGRRLLDAWRGVAQLGMLLDGRAHAWSGEAVGDEPGRRRSPVKGTVAGAPRMARVRA